MVHSIVGLKKLKCASLLHLWRFGRWRRCQSAVVRRSHRGNRGVREANWCLRSQRFFLCFLGTGFLWSFCTNLWRCWNPFLLGIRWSRMPSSGQRGHCLLEDFPRNRRYNFLYSLLKVNLIGRIFRRLTLALRPGRLLSSWIWIYTFRSRFWRMHSRYCTSYKPSFLWWWSYTC